MSKWLKKAYEMYSPFQKKVAYHVFTHNAPAKDDYSMYKKGTKLEHYSPEKGLTEISPTAAMGRGVDRNIKGGGRGVNTEHPHSFYYRAGTQPEDVVVGQANSKYTVEIPEEAKLYDLATDPEQVISNLKQQSMSRQINPGSITMDDVHQELKNRGYHGFFHSQHPHGLENVVALYHAQPVQSEESLKNE